MEEVCVCVCGLPPISQGVSPLPAQDQWNADKHHTLASRTVCMQLCWREGWFVHVPYRNQRGVICTGISELDLHRVHPWVGSLISFVIHFCFFQFWALRFLSVLFRCILPFSFLTFPRSVLPFLPTFFLTLPSFFAISHFSCTSVFFLFTIFALFIFLCRGVLPSLCPPLSFLLRFPIHPLFLLYFPTPFPVVTFRVFGGILACCSHITAAAVVYMS